MKTTDSYLLRVFVIGFTKKMPNQIKKTCYAQHAKVSNLSRKFKVKCKALLFEFNMKKNRPKIVAEKSKRMDSVVYSIL